MKRNRVIVLGFGVTALVAIGIAATSWWTTASPGNGSTVGALVTHEVTPRMDLRGPRPLVSRLRQGACQVDNVDKAVTAARSSLARAKAEIGTGAAVPETLRKQALIEAVARRLEQRAMDRSQQL
jgi:hypothetical protein